MASFTAPPSGNGVIQYYLQINYTDHATTFLYGNNSTSNATGSEPTAAANAYTFQFIPSLTVNGVNANYTTSHLYMDEIAGDSVSLTIILIPNAANVDPATVQVFTNLNRRDYATLRLHGRQRPPDGGGNPSAKRRSRWDGRQPLLQSLYHVTHRQSRRVHHYAQCPTAPAPIA